MWYYNEITFSENFLEKNLFILTCDETFMIRNDRLNMPDDTVHGNYSRLISNIIKNKFFEFSLWKYLPKKC